MGDFFSGLEKFGFNDVSFDNIFKEEQNVSATVGENVQKQVEPPKEEDFLLEKTVKCPVCDCSFKSLMVKNGKARRLEPDRDLRPRYEYIDTIKYDISSCPKCGYTAINRYFSHLSSAQIKWIKEEISSKFKPSDQSYTKYTYDEAIERYKLALINTMAKKGKASEKAYECLKIAWLYRGKKEELKANQETDATKLEIAKCEQFENAFYSQAFEGFLKAISSESYPMCGMESTTVDFLMANMAFILKRYDLASRYVAGLLTSSMVSRQIKDKCLTLKEEILNEIKSRPN